ncbi:topoisomerase DNA-binding C4 zinc finger domain-containing protein, partial [Rhizobium ruizarguesonis]
VFPKREDGSDPRICQVCGTGNLSLKLGKYGAFVGCSNYPECNYTRHLHAVGSHIGDETDRLAADIDALIEPLGDLH